MFKRRIDTTQADGVKALQELTAHLGAIALSLQKLEEIIPKVEAIYEVYRDLNQSK